jgi:hypothetical protein
MAAASNAARAFALIGNDRAQKAYETTGMRVIG